MKRGIRPKRFPFYLNNFLRAEFKIRHFYNIFCLLFVLFYFCILFTFAVFSLVFCLCFFCFFFPCLLSLFCLLFYVLFYFNWPTLTQISPLLPSTFTTSLSLFSPLFFFFFCSLLLDDVQRGVQSYPIPLYFLQQDSVSQWYIFFKSGLRGLIVTG